MFSVTDFTQLITQILPEPQAGLLNGIAFGSKASLDTGLKDALITTGTLHIVALSGMNVSILANLLTQTLLPFISRRKVCLLILALLIWFVSFVGPSPSIIRAAIMGGISTIGIFFGRQIWPLGVWALAAISMLIWQPDWLFDLSFQLSVLATLGLLLYGTPPPFKPSDFSSRLSPHTKPSRLVHFLSEFRGLVVKDLRITLAAQVFTIPVVFFAFGRISLISPITNILIGWTMPMLTVLGWLVPVFIAVYKPLGIITGWVGYSLLTYVVWIVRTTSLIPFASIQLK